MSSRLTTFSNGKYTFDVIDEGPLDGPPVVLLHGFPQTGASWARLVPHLHARGFRTFAPTQRGYSPGARPRSRFQYRIGALVGDTLALIDALGTESVHLVGHNWGSTVGWAVAARHPHRVKSFVSISVPHPVAFLRACLTSSQSMRSWYMLAFQVPWIPERILGMKQQLREGLAGTGMVDDQIDRIVDDVAGTGAMHGAVNWYRAMFIAGPEALRKVTVPTTHVWSTRDGLMARKTAELAGDYVTGPYRLEVLDATHWVPDDCPEELAAIIAERAGSTGVG
ncbi:alpha/beta fold hydrolase [Smaragdicoccus niigatensis]|uniref:alpha/beta fold hydrolase n=1 Tax=Smaragdicoccus niigatensis TaxID=359359 RepID=UPI000368FC63|nr:alpha/beta fold hydrolase [Smaragdicoccus niigatensis]